MHLVPEIDHAKVVEEPTEGDAEEEDEKDYEVGLHGSVRVGTGRVSGILGRKKKGIDLQSCCLSCFSLLLLFCMCVICAFAPLATVSIFVFLSNTSDR